MVNNSNKHNINMSLNNFICKNLFTLFIIHESSLDELCFNIEIEILMKI